MMRTFLLHDPVDRVIAFNCCCLEKMMPTFVAAFQCCCLPLDAGTAGSGAEWWGINFQTSLNLLFTSLPPPSPRQSMSRSNDPGHFFQTE